MGQSICSESVPAMNGIPPLTITQKLETIKQSLPIKRNQFFEMSKRKASTKQNQDKQNAQLFSSFVQPYQIELNLSNEEFQSYSHKKLLDKLGALTNECDVTISQCIYKFKNGSLYKGALLDGQKNGKRIEIMKKMDLYMRVNFIKDKQMEEEG